MLRFDMLGELDALSLELIALQRTNEAVIALVLLDVGFARSQLAECIDNNTSNNGNHNDDNEYLHDNMK